MKSNKKISAILTVFFLFLFIGVSAGIPLSPLPGGEDVEVIVKKVFPSVVKVETQNWTKRVATGVIFDKKGHIVTTALVSPRNEKIAVITSDGKEYEAEFLGMDSETHIAVLRIKEKKLDPITTAKAKGLSSGTWIGVVSVSPENTPATSQGIVSSVSNDALRLNVWVFPGWSGSPVINKEGNMVGLLRGVYSNNQPVVFEFREREVVGSGLVYSRAEAPSSGVALAIPIDIVSKIAAEIIEKGKVERGWLGVYISENEEREVLITGIDNESPAQLANLKEGDKMLKIDGKKITGSEMLSHEIRKRKPGRDINLEIERNGEVLKTRAKLGDYPEKEAKREFEFKFPNLFPPVPAKPPKIPRPPRVEIFPERLLPERFLRAWGSRKYIGVFLEELTDELSKFFGVKKGGGLLVSKFSEDSPAQKAGLKVGDVIVKVDGVQVNTIDQLSEFIQDKKKGEKIKIEFLRNKKQMSANIEVKEEEREGFFKRYFFSEDLSNSSESFSKINVVVPRIYFGLRI